MHDTGSDVDGPHDGRRGEQHRGCGADQGVHQGHRLGGALGGRQAAPQGVAPGGTGMNTLSMVYVGQAVRGDFKMQGQSSEYSSQLRTMLP